MKREKNYKTAKFIEALEHIDPKYVEEAGKKIKERPTGQTVAGMSRAKSLRQVLALVACVLLLSAVIPAVTYLMGHLPDILGSSTGDDTTEQTSPETPPEETSAPAPETSVNTEAETTAPLYDGTTAPPEPEHNGSYGLEYKMNEDGRSAMLFHRGICTDENVIVASVWNGVPVTRISEAALAEYVKYKTITIPESVTAIDMRAFKNCTGLESVVLHDGISYIGADAFENCVALTEITLPKSLEWIQTGLFMNCINLQKVIIGNEVERIVFGAFYDCSALRELHYLGTKAEWNKIQKDLDWNVKSAITVVHCSDGDVEITPYTPDEAVYDGSRGLEYRIEGDHAILVGIGTCTDDEIVIASTYNGVPVTTIRFDAFLATNAESVIISDSITTIKGSAFRVCENIMTLHIPKGVVTIEAGAFMHMNSLSSITVDPENPNYIAKGNCLIEKNSKLLIRGCSASVIPTDGSVITIGMYAFSGSEALKSIVIPSGVKLIDQRAFVNCTGLSSITLPDTLTEIEEVAFSGCVSLQSIVFPNSVKSIGLHAFLGCTSLKQVTFGEGELSLGTCVFEECPALEQVVLPEGMTKLSDSFFCTNLKSMTIPSTVTVIESYAFDGLEKLTNVYFAGTVKQWNSIDKWNDWDKNMSFTVVHCSDGDVDLIEYDGSRGLEYRIIGDHAEITGIGTCTDTEIVIPSYYSGYPVTQINTWAFKDNTRITSVKISDTVAMIAGNAFSGCTSLNSIYISASVIDVTALSFDGCTNITSITVDPDNPYYEGTNCIIQKSNKWLLLGCRTTVIPADGSVEYIGGCSFNGISGLYSITVPEGVIDIDTSAFNNCPDLRELHLPSTLRSASGGESNIISGCNNIEVITIPKNSEYFYVDGNCLIERKTGTLILGCKTSVIPTDGSIKAIGNYAFHGNLSLRDVVLPEGITSIGEGAFASCRNLKSIVFPKSLTKIGAWAFENCSSLEKINIPENVTLISYGAFRACTKLTEAALPRSLKELSWDSFGQCTALKEIRFTGTKKEWNSITKDNSWYYGSSINAIRCSDGDVNLIEYDGSQGLEYKIVGDHALLIGIGTCTDKNIVVATKYNGLPVTEIDDFAFENVGGFTSITVSEGIASIGLDAFGNCPDLREIYLPTTLESISGGEGIAFYGCNALEIISVASGNPKYISVGNCLIERESKILAAGCKNSKIPTDGSVTVIGYFAFIGIDTLKNIVIPEGVTEISGYAFAGCGGLESITLPNSLTSLGDRAFGSCVSLGSITLSDNVTFLGGGVFSGCTSLKDVRLPARVEYLGEETFAGCAIESIVIPKGVTDLSGGMFTNCTKLKSVTFLDRVENLGMYTFYRCTSLTEFNVPEGVKIIGQCAFEDCANLVRITLPASVEKIEQNAFSGCSRLTNFRYAGTKAEWAALKKNDTWNKGCPFTLIHCSDGDVELYGTDGSQGLEYWVSDDGRSASLVGIGTCTDKDIIIASTYNGVPVTEILPSAFRNNGNIRSVRISDSVEVIGYEAFSGCKALESIYIGAGLREIGGEAFLGNSVLSNITVDAKNPYFSGNGYCIVEKSTKTLILGCSHTVIPTDGSVKEIGANAFYGNELLSTITIPEGVTSISGFAFHGCTNLVIVDLPESLKTIGPGAFSLCTRLQSIDIPQSVTVIAYSSFTECTNLRSVTGGEGVTLIEAKAFEGCTKLEAFTFANKLTQIDSLAFKNCSALKSIDIPASVTEIGQEVFSGCTALESVTIRGSVQSLYGGVFAKCSSLKNVNLHGSVGSVSDYAFEYCTSLERITLPEGTKIGRGAFYECTALESINIPRGGTEIGAEAFSGCTSLTAIIIPEGVEKIKLEAFYRCKNLASVTLPSTLTEIGSWAFAECENLESIVLPDSVVRVSDRAFSDCRKLSSVKFGKNVELIMENAFLYCTSLKSVTLPGSLIELCNSAFAGCSGLEDVTFEKGIDRLGFGVFSDCLKLDEITFTGSIAEWDNVFVPEDAFGNIEIKRINCADGVINNSEPEAPSLEYKLAPDGRSARVVGIGGIADSDIVIDATYLGVPVTEIADSAFFGCSNITSVVIPDGVTKIGAHAFSLCSSLESIVLPDGVTSIGEYAFHACENLKTADLGESVMSIGSNAFFACRRLDSIDLGGKLQTIGDSAFFECVSLKSLTLPKTLKSIGAMAFSECKSIESVTYNGTAAEWKKITLDEMWAFESSIALVKCSDGDVKK